MMQLTCLPYNIQCVFQKFILLNFVVCVKQSSTTEISLNFSTRKYEAPVYNIYISVIEYCTVTQ
jgi:hypothetical protein